MMNIPQNIRNRHFLLLDILLLASTPWLALALRLDGFFRLTSYGEALLRYAVLALGVKISVLFLLGMYQRYWRYASIEELLLILKSISLAGAWILLSFFLLYRPWFAPLPRSLPFIDILLTVAIVATPRFGVRLLARRQHRGRGDAKRVVIFGAGDAGQLLAREMQQNPALGYDLLGFLDDDPEKQGLHMRGRPILGGRDAIPELVTEYKIQEIIIAMPSASGRVIREIVNLCEQVQVKTRILPGFAEMLNGDVSVRRLRPVDINDLLRRDPISTDLRAVNDLVKGKTVLVTGAGGSIGSELCRQIAKAHPRKLLLLGHGENSIFEIHNELKAAFKGGKEQDNPFTPIIADVRDAARLNQVFERHRPQVVFHAAAHKHVPMMEANPLEAISNNILGSYTLLQTCLSHNVERFVLVSTDKAVNPVNVMGVTKRVAELLVQQAAQRSGRPYVAVRFGNVLGSRGSVVPFFKKQIAAGGPVTVTHPEVTRYFMTIPEAVQLVLQAATMGQPGDLFMLEMGEPVRIVDLAQDLIRLSGLTPDEDIEIKFIGLRPGEKLAEELYQGHEDHAPTEHEKILRVTSRYQQPQDLAQALDLLYDLTRAGRVRDALALIAGLVPEYRPPVEVSPRTVEDITHAIGDLVVDELDFSIPLSARWY